MSEIVNKYQKLRDESPMNSDEILLFDYYDIENTLTVIDKQNAKHVALQFPDELLSDSFYVFNTLSKNVSEDCQLYVLGDTSYNSCCVDVVAASHINTDLIIHYGDTCLSFVDSIPIYYVYGKKSLDIDSIIGSFSDIAYKLSGSVLLAYESCFKQTILEVYTQLKEMYSDIILGEIPNCQNLHTELYKTNMSSFSDYSTYTRLGSNFFKTYNKDENKYILYIGNSNKASLCLCMNCMLSTVYRFDNDYITWKIDTRGRREIMSRYACIENAKESNVFGIVVGTLSVQKYNLIINHIKNLLFTHEKSYYVLSVGKINYPKLANLPGIDSYILVGCPRSIFHDDDELKALNILTPFDLEILFETHPWTGEYELDYNQLISEQDTILLNQPEKKVQKNEKTGEEVLYIPTPSSALVEFKSSALDLIQEKHYQGLQQNENAEITSIQEGKHGIAWEYNSEVTDELF